ncbi:MAG: ATP-dependent ligase [Streptosporangiaceae bacterium]|nr:ATP-dependent ligase [Streptosporangiaceae bacterium]
MPRSDIGGMFMRIRGAVEPMLARLAERLPAPDAVRGGYRYEPKLDGYRCIVIVDDQGGVRLRSRRGARMEGAFPEIVAAAAAHLPAGTVADGELVRWSEDGRLDFAALRHRCAAGRHRAPELARIGPCHVVLFDLLETGGRDVRPLPLAERREILQGLMTAVPATSPLALSPQTRDITEARLWLEVLPAHGVEGVMVKAADQPYLGGRRGWLKIKHRDTVEAVIGGVTGSLDRPDRLLLGRYAEGSGRLKVVGNTGAVPPRVRDELARRLTAAEPDHPWPARLCTSWGRPPAEYARVEPLLVAEVTVDPAVDHGRWRHPARFVRLRDDMSPGDVPPPAG